MLKNLSAMKETQVWSLGWEDPMEKEIATPSSILAWRILWTEDPGRLQFMGSQRIRHARVTNTFTLSRLQMTGVKPLASMWGGASIKLQIIVKTIVGVTESNIGLKNRKKMWLGEKFCVYCIRYTHRTWIQNASTGNTSLNVRREGRAENLMTREV